MTLLVLTEDPLSVLKLVAGGGAVVAVIVSCYLQWKGFRGIQQDHRQERKEAGESHLQERKDADDSHARERAETRKDFLDALRAERDDNRASTEKLAAAINRLSDRLEQAKP